MRTHAGSFWTSTSLGNLDIWSTLLYSRHSRLAILAAQTTACYGYNILHIIAARKGGVQRRRQSFY